MCSITFFKHYLSLNVFNFLNLRFFFILIRQLKIYSFQSLNLYNVIFNLQSEFEKEKITYI